MNNYALLITVSLKPKEESMAEHDDIDLTH